MKQNNFINEPRTFKEFPIKDWTPSDCAIYAQENGMLIVGHEIKDEVVIVEMIQWFPAEN